MERHFAGLWLKPYHRLLSVISVKIALSRVPVGGQIGFRLVGTTG
jgi:hypothetical protein